MKTSFAILLFSPGSAPFASLAWDLRAFDAVTSTSADRDASADGEVLLVFQDQRNSDVHTFSVRPDDGVVTGCNMIRIPADPR